MTQKSLHEVIELTVELAAPRASGDGLSLTCHIDSGFKQLRKFDDWCITQLISNLLNNALRYTQRGGVTVAARCSQQDNSQLHHFEISIADTGPGIEPEIRRMMFAHPEQREGMPGGIDIGVGLVIASQLSEMMGATLTVEPGREGGTIATVRGTLDESESTTGESSNLPSALRNTQAIIVDGDMAARRLLEAHLRSWGIDVRSVLDVDSAIDHAQTASEHGRRISMVFVSHDITEAGIARLVQTLDATPLHAEAMLVVLGSDITSSINQIVFEGTNSITLMKPVRPSELYNCISQHPQVMLQVKTDTDVTTPAVETSDRHVLLVEDNIVNQCVAAEILKRIGAQVTIANNGIEALQKLQESTFDFVFMDCQMPEMDGFEATRNIRLNPEFKLLPVVALTANALTGDRQKCMDAGMSDYLTKPFTREQLASMLDKWIGQSDSQLAETNAQPIDESTLIDNDALDQIRQLDSDGETAIFDEIIGEYLASSRSLVKQIDDAVLKVDPKGVSRVAHALKSSSAAVGMAQFAKQCAALERMGMQSDSDGISELWQQCQPVYQQSLKVLETINGRQVA